MARDLILGRTRRNWARGGSCMSDEVTLRLTPDEMKKLADLALVRQRADAGDRAALRKMGELQKHVKGLTAKSKRGDPRATRALLVLRESGALRGVTSVSMGGDGDVPNTVYRAAVLRHAMRVAGNKRPTTKDFYRAKSSVDHAMNKAGLSIYLPGSRPARVTA